MRLHAKKQQRSHTQWARQLLGHIKGSLTGFAVAIVVSSCVAQSPSSSPDLPSAPDLSIPKSEAVWTFFCDPNRRMDVTDRLKCRKVGGAYVSLSGELRNRGEYFDHIILGSNSASSGYLLQRYFLSADVTSGSKFRFFTTLESGLENGRTGGPRQVVDEDRLFVHEGFVELRNRAEKPSIDLRVGRQDISFGAGRLVGRRELPNVQANYDGALAKTTLGSFQMNFLAFRPSINSPGIFDDVPDHTSSLWGVYTTKASKHFAWDTYYFGIDRKSVTFQAGSGREQRQSIGLRVANEHNRWDSDSEVTYQFGSFAGRPIKAWTATTYTGYTLGDMRSGTSYRLAIDTGIASGNKNPTQGSFGTFNALFPKGAFFGYANFIGPYNVQVIRPSLRIATHSSRLVIWPNVEWLWRQSKQDGVYSIPAVLVRPGSANDALFIGFQADLNITWRQNRHITWDIDGEHFFAGQFLHQTTAGKSVNYLAPGVVYRF